MDAMLKIKVDQGEGVHGPSDIRAVRYTFSSCFGRTALSTKNGSSTHTVNGVASRPGRPSKESARPDAIRGIPPYGSPGARRPPARPGPRYPDALPADEFMYALRREKRRCERSRAALSLVIYRPHGMHEHAARYKDKLLDLLCLSKRENDIVGDVGDAIAVLCPDTDEQGHRGFTGKIGALAADLPFTAVAATYPDDLFKSVAKSEAAGPSDERPFQPFVDWDVEHVRSGYSGKRCLDIVGALTAFALLAPLMLLVAAAIALTSRGPVIFKQTRLGRGGVPFTFYKFRSMVANVDDGIHREYVSSIIRGKAPVQGALNGVPYTPYKLQSDPRVTRVGRLIRKTSIDELPQFFNVLKGEMSLVGPRPPIPYETQHYEAWHLRRILTMKPGITGVWQVEGRSKVAFDDMVRMDLRYIRECSFALDISILLRTIIVVVRCQGAT